MYLYKDIFYALKHTSEFYLTIFCSMNRIFKFHRVSNSYIKLNKYSFEMCENSMLETKNVS